VNPQARDAGWQARGPVMRRWAMDHSPFRTVLPGRILGIDAGGSGTHVVILEHGTVTEQPAGPPMNALLTNGFVTHLQEIIEAARPAAAGIGLPGVRQEDQARRIGQALTRQTGCPVHVTSDGASAQAGAFLGEPGVVVIAGTG